MTSSPLRPGDSLEEELDYYKKQYEQLEADLADFQASSKELEEQLERDVDNAEKRERKLKEQLEKQTFEVEEWKTKHKQAKTEANSAQNGLQKEITTLRDSNRSLQLRLRDTEVTNDDYERQARNNESSLEDMESKYNVAMERGILLKHELKYGEQERESLRTETQRLRDELSELKVENEITLEKLRFAEEAAERLRSRKPSPPAMENLRAKSPISEISGFTPSSPTASTPPANSRTASEAATPPSPPLSDVPATATPRTQAPITTKKQPSRSPNNGSTPRQFAIHSMRTPRHSRGPSITSSSLATSDTRAMKPPAKPRMSARPSTFGTIEALPRSDSLLQIRNLRGRMQKIEERVQSARSKLPAPKNITPRNSPRTTTNTGPITQNDSLPTSVTLRRSIRRPSGIPASLRLDDMSENASEEAEAEAVETPSRRQSHINKRLSYGLPRPASVASNHSASQLDRPPSSAGQRPSSRLSLASAGNNRPPSRAETQTPVKSYPTAQDRRASSRTAGAYATVHGTPRSHHRPSSSVSDWRRSTTAATQAPEGVAASPHRPLSSEASSMLSPSSTARRTSSGLPQARSVGRRPNVGIGLSSNVDTRRGMMPPPPTKRDMSDVGETY